MPNMDACGHVISNSVYGTEIELSFGPPEWAALDPIDESTQQIVQNGFWILLDPTGLLNRLLQALMHYSK